MPEYKGETSSRKLQVPLGSRLMMISQHPNGVWRVWMGINDRNLPLRKAMGTFVELHPNGEAYTTTIRPDGEETTKVMEVMDE